MIRGNGKVKSRVFAVADPDVPLGDPGAVREGQVEDRRARVHAVLDVEVDDGRGRREGGGDGDGP